MSDSVSAAMGEAVPASGTVHWLGTGWSTGSGLRVLAERATRTLLWARTVDKAVACSDRLELHRHVEPRALTPAALSAQLQPGDVLVSMLPASEHAELLRLCITHGAHFACSSYVSPALAAQAPAAQCAGLVVLTEAGLDPGIDHLLAHDLVARAREAIGEGPAAVRFASFCGGIPAVANEFRYRFSWSPRAVLNALREPARYVIGGVERVAPQPWDDTRDHMLGAETFEVYPNRDSLPYVRQYDLPAGWRLDTFVRATVRMQGWRKAWQPVFSELGSGDRGRIADLADQLAARYPMTKADRDRVILAVALVVSGDAGRAWSDAYLLDVIGDETENAMARCVSVPLAYGVAEILAGRLPAGLRRAAEGGAQSRAWLSFLRPYGIDCRSVDAGDIIGDYDS